uniref:Uncharacterized protein C1orf167 homolog isoform X1 n=2 Tax=Pogona vitticeps TaxID=103695 RepID=A0ABM5EKC4_9SAUR
MRWASEEANISLTGAMENLTRIPQSRRKENIPPLFSRYGTLEQRNVQKNVNRNVDLFAENLIRVSDPAASGSTCPGAIPQGKSQSASLGKKADKPHHTSRVQTNFSCPDWLLGDLSSPSPSQKQSNLACKLQRHGSENGSRIAGPPLLPAGLCSHLGQPGLKRDPLKKLPCRHHAARHTCPSSSEVRIQGKDPQALKQSQGPTSVPRRRGGNLDSQGGASFPSQRSEVSSFPHHPHPSVWCPERSVDPSPALTVDHLDTSPPSERRPSSAAFQALLRSSQTSAELHSSLRRLEEQLAMGALGSSPRESKSPRPYRSSSNPRASSLGTPSLAEWLAEEQSYAKHARAKWHPSFRGDWRPGPTSDGTGDHDGASLLTGFNNFGLYASSVDPRDGSPSAGFYSQVGATSLGQGEDLASSRSILFEPGSRPRWALERKRTWSDPKERGLDDPSAGTSCPSKGGPESLPSGLLSVEDLEISLKTLGAKASLDTGVSLFDTPREVPLRVGSLGGLEIMSARWLHHRPKDLDVGEPQGQAGDAGRDPSIANWVGECGSFLAHRRLSPFGAAAREGLREGARMAGRANVVDFIDPVGGTAGGSSNSTHCDPRTGEGGDPKQGSCIHPARPNDDLLGRKESDHALDAVQEEDLGKEDRPMDKKRDGIWMPGSGPVLAKSFLAWRDHVLEKKAAARGLYERQLLRKGLAALQWAVELRNLMVGIAQRSHALAVLAASFRRWQDATAEQRAVQPQEERAPEPGPPAPSGRDGFGKRLLWTQLSRDHQEEAARYSRAEVGIWMQFRHTHGADELCRKVEAVRDMRRLAAAFRLWCLQKERLDRVEARAREAHDLLQKKKLSNLFRKWRSRYRANRRTWQVVARIQRGLIGRCFEAWKRFADREVVSRRALERLRVGSLSLCFHQWTQMVQIREKAKHLLVEFMAVKRRKSYEKLGLAARTTIMQACVDVEKWSQRSGTSPFDGLLYALTLQKAFLMWKARWWESHLATIFSQALTKRQLREALAFWWWKTLSLQPLGLKASGDLTEDYLLASLGSEASSLSSGFHSSVPALPTSRGSLEKENSLEDNSNGSISSSAIGEDSGPLPARESPVPRWSPVPESLPDVAVESHSQAPSPLHRPQAGAFVLGSGASSQGAALHEAALQFQHSRERHLLASCLGRWEAALRRARQGQRQEGRVRGGPVGPHDAVRRWRKATRGYRELRFRSVNQAGSYWTRASAVRLCSLQQSSHIGARKRRKLYLGGSSRRRRNGEEGPHPGSAVPPSAFRAWLAVYRRQSRSLAEQHPQKCPEVAGQLPGGDRIREGHKEAILATSRKQWLRRKYWSLWRRNVLLRHFRSARETRHLVNSWLCWKEAARTQQVIRALVRRRLAEWSWNTWRRRCLRSWVAEHFRATHQRCLLEKAFGRWRLSLAQKPK